MGMSDWVSQGFQAIGKIHLQLTDNNIGLGARYIGRNWFEIEEVVLEERVGIPVLSKKGTFENHFVG